MPSWQFVVVDLEDPNLPKDPRQVTYENGGLAFCDDWRDVRAMLRFYKGMKVGVRKFRWQRDHYWRTHMRRHV